MSRPEQELIATIGQAVDRWRGFSLGNAGEAWREPGRYLSTRQEEKPVSDTTKILLQHWFRTAPHELPGSGQRFRYWPHQRRFVEAVIYLHEVRGIRSAQELYDTFEIKRDFTSFDPWPKLGGQLATGSGKTKMMSLLIAWTTLNAVREGAAHLGLGPQVLVLAPGLFVKERLLFDFNPPDRPSVFRADPVIPPTLAPDWRLRVYGPDTAPQRIDPLQPALIVSNIDQLYRIEEEGEPWPTSGRQERLMFDTPDPKRLEGESIPLISRFRRGPGMLVINDEAHHVGDEPKHQRFETAAANKRAAGVESSTEMAWIRSLRALHSRAGLGLQVDLSATLYEEGGGARQGKAASAPKMFRHTVIDYPLREAILDGVVKQPVLEAVRVKDADGTELPPERENQPNAWLRYEALLRAGIGRWRKVRDQMKEEGDHRKPILFLLCADRNEAQEIANMLTYGEASREDLSSSHSLTGWKDPQSGEQLFVDDGGAGRRSTVIQIHVGEKENKNEAEWAKVRAQINAVDHDEIPDPSGARDPYGAIQKLPNPYNVVISVMMLKEGWDVRNVKVIVPLRSCDSRTLTEQTLGRGLRRMRPPELDEDGAVRASREELFVMQHPSFASIIEQIKDIVELRDGDEAEAPGEYVRIDRVEEEAKRQRYDLRYLYFLGIHERHRDWRENFKMPSAIHAEKPEWRTEFQDQEVSTWLRATDEGQDSEGQRFELPAAPTFRDYDRVVEVAYVGPLLRDLKVAWIHRNTVKLVVKDWLEQRCFRFPPGVFMNFDRALSAGPESARITVANLLRPEVMGASKKALIGPIREAMAGRGREQVAEIQEQRAATLGAYAARKKFELLETSRSVFRNGAFDSEEELRFAIGAGRSEDVLGWLYNHRQGVGFRIEYDWQGNLSSYFPDFLVRVLWAGKIHNLIVEVKGRMDQRDQAKAAAGRRYAATLEAHDVEPWHYLLVQEDPKVGREDLSFWEQLGRWRLGDLFAKIEGISPVEQMTAGRWLTRDIIGRRLESLAAENGGLLYDVLMKLAEEGTANGDRLLSVAERLTHGREPRLLRSFVDTKRHQFLSDAELGQRLAKRSEMEDGALDGIEVVYRPVRGAS